ncbi:hypothetical protein ES705_28301 [subsurface metagenome]
MKRKYFLLVLVLVLSTFFLFNVLSVDAVLYKVLDEEGKLIRLTNEPVLSVSEEEAGYTLDPPVIKSEEENISETQTVTTNQDDLEEGSVGKWTHYTEINPIDDTTMIAFGLKCEDATSRSPVLVLRWDDGKTQLVISWNNYLSDNTRVTYRFDKGKAVTKNWSGSTSKTATFYPGKSKTVIKFIQKLMEADKLAVQITPYNEGPTTAVFDVRELKNAVEEFNDTLGWIKVEEGE